MTERRVAESGQARRAGVGAVDLGGRHIACALGDVHGRLLSRLRRDLLPGETPDSALSWAAEAIRRLLRPARIRPGELRAVGFAAPGLVHAEAGEIVGAANLPGWVRVPVAAILGQALGVPVRLENDANMAALGEWWRGAGAGRASLLFLALGTGIGGGVIIDGHLQRGSHNLAGEIGYTCLGRQYLEMDFGLSGCLEHLAAAPGVVRRAREALGQRLPPSATARDVFELALAGDADAARVRDETAVFLGIAIANAVALLDPEIVVLGGGMSQHGEPLLTRVKETVERIVPVRPEIVLSALGEEAQLYGAIFAALEMARGGPKSPAL